MSTLFSHTYRKKWLALSLLFSLCLSATGCYHHADKEKSDIAGIIPQQECCDAFPSVEARYSSWPDPDTMFVYIDGTQNKISACGDVFNADGSRRFNVGCEGQIETLYFIQRGSSIFFFFSDLTEDGSACFVKRFDCKTNKLVWATKIDGIAMCRPVIKGQFAYLGLFGFVGKLKLKDGNFDWKYSGLNNNGKFEKFQDILFPSNREVVFVAPHLYSQVSDTLAIADLPGEINLMN